MPRLLSLDPGGTTGYAVFDDGKLVEWGEFPLWELLPALMSGVDDIIYEDIRPRDRAFDLSGLYVIGVIKYLAEQSGQPITPRPPAMMRAARKWGFKVDQTGSPHSADAIAHGITYLGYEKASIGKLVTEKS